MEKHNNAKEVYSCADCGNTDVLLLAWVDPNNGNRFIGKVDDTFDGLCNKCGDCVKLEIKIVEIKTDGDPWRCEECGSLDIKPKVLIDSNSDKQTSQDANNNECFCNDCKKHTNQILESELLKIIEDWWMYLDDCEKEDITGIDAGLFDIGDSDEKLQEANHMFTTVCNNWWDKKTNKEKIEIWKEYI